MKSLRERGDKSLEVQNYKEAIRYYNEALEIDEQNVDVLLARAVALIEMGDYIGAQRDTEMLVSQDSDNHKVCLFACCKTVGLSSISLTLYSIDTHFDTSTLDSF